MDRKDPQREQRRLEPDEIRLIGDLRIMHAKVDELHQIVAKLKQRHSEADIRKYADTHVLDENIARVDEIYLWFLSLKEEGLRQKSDPKRRV
jgi:hypothetical protein